VPTIHCTAELTIPKGVNGTEVLSMEGEGIKGGTQYVRLRIILPGAEADQALEKAVKDWAQKQHFNPRAGLQP
jgi:DnaJ-class molecular chaperone